MKWRNIARGIGRARKEGKAAKSYTKRAVKSYRKHGLYPPVKAHMRKKGQFF